jgi:hypothetical protein
MSKEKIVDPVQAQRAFLTRRKSIIKANIENELAQLRDIDVKIREIDDNAAKEIKRL